jgi:hypothetical protein
VDERRDWIAIEGRMFNEGADMAEPDRIGTRAALTCPARGGIVREFGHPGPPRYPAGHVLPKGTLRRTI